jgi:hypothetical protein
MIRLPAGGIRRLRINRGRALRAVSTVLQLVASRRRHDLILTERFS